MWGTRCAVNFFRFVLLCCRYFTAMWAKLTWGAGLDEVMYQEPVSLAPEGRGRTCAWSVHCELCPVALVYIDTGVHIYTQSGTFSTKQQRDLIWQAHTLAFHTSFICSFLKLPVKTSSFVFKFYYCVLKNPRDFIGCYWSTVCWHIHTFPKTIWERELNIQVADQDWI